MIDLIMFNWTLTKGCVCEQCCVCPALPWAWHYVFVQNFAKTNLWLEQRLQNVSV